MKEFDVFDKSESVVRTLLLEASAGTGKTFSIENIVLRAITEDFSFQSEPLLAEELLVVTFTKASANELSTRIFKKLKEAEKTLPKVEKKRVRRAISEFDLATISTIHSFCQTAIKDHTMHSLKNPEGRGKEEFVFFQIEKFFRSDLNECFLSKRQLEALLSTYGGTTKLAKAILKSVEGGIPFCKGRENEELLKALSETLKCLPISSCVERNAKFFYGLTERDSKKIKNDFFEIFLGFEEALKNEPLTLDHFQHPFKPILDAFLAIKASERKKKSTISCEDNALFEKIEKRALPLMEELFLPSHLFARLAYYFQKKLYSSFDQEGGSNFSFLLFKMFFLVKEDPLFVEALRKKYRLVVIDEFQDTDPQQWAIFREIFLEAKIPVILVGDPKQSIYAFRSADIYTYLEAKQRIDPENHYLLNKNYRSSKRVIGAINHLFSKERIHAAFPLPETGDEMPYQEVLYPALPGKEDLDSGCVKVLMARGEKDEKQLSLEEIEEKQLFPFFAEEVRDLIDSQQVIPSEIAFLVRDKHQGERLSTYLESCSIPSDLYRAKRLSATPMLEELERLLRAIQRPRDIPHLKKVLGGKIFSFSIKELEALDDHEKLSEWILFFQSFHDVRQKEGVLGVVDRVLRSEFQGKRIRDGLLLQAQGKALYHELMQAAESTANLEREEDLSEEEVLLHLESLILKENQEDDVELLPLKQEGSVQIMTMHRSKGLEFRAVFALGIVNRTKKERSFARVRLTDGVYLSPLYSEDEREEGLIFETDAEKARQLYVALTRAKSFLYLPFIYGWKRPSFGTASPVELHMAKINVVTDGKALYERLPLPKDEVEAFINQSSDIDIVHLEEKERPHFHFRGDKSVLFLNETPFLPYKKRTMMSFSSLKRLSLPDHYTAPSTPSSLPRGAAVGVLLHHIFETLPASLMKDAKTKEDLHPFLEKSLKMTPLEGHLEEVSRLVFNSITTPIGEEKIVLSKLESEACFREMEFLYEAESSDRLKGKEGFLRGVVDLFFEWKGKYYLLDFKSHDLGDSDLSYTEEAMLKVASEGEYRLQLELYEKAVELYLERVCHLPFNEVFGGSILLFVRGSRALIFKPSKTV